MRAYPMDPLPGPCKGPNQRCVLSVIRPLTVAALLTLRQFTGSTALFDKFSRNSMAWYLGFVRVPSYVLVLARHTGQRPNAFSLSRRRARV